MNSQTFYRDFYLSAMSTPTDDGRYQARVAIVMLDASRTRSQRFLDLETYVTAPEADARGLAAGREWVDALGRGVVGLRNSSVLPGQALE